MKKLQLEIKKIASVCEVNRRVGAPDKNLEHYLDALEQHYQVRLKIKKTGYPILGNTRESVKRWAKKCRREAPV